MNLRSPEGNKDLDALDEMIEEISVDAYGDDEKFWAFRQAFEDNVDLPADGFVIGEPARTTSWKGATEAGLRNT